MLNMISSKNEPKWLDELPSLSAQPDSSRNPSFFACGIYKTSTSTLCVISRPFNASLLSFSHHTGRMSTLGGDGGDAISKRDPMRAQRTFFNGSSKAKVSNKIFFN